MDLPKEKQVLPESEHYLGELTRHIPTLPNQHILSVLTQLAILEGNHELDINMEDISNKLKS